MSKETIIINGRFLEQRITGVQRVAYEFVKSLDELIKEDLSFTKYNFILYCPKGSSDKIQLNNIPVMETGLFNGHLWEQISLPLISFGKTIINLCGPAPILKKKQMVTIHDAAIYANSDNFSASFKLWYKTMFFFFKIRSLKIITVSNFSKSELVKYCSFDKEKVKAVHLGVDHFSVPTNEVSEDTILSKFQIEKGQFVLAVSSMAPNKNFKSVVQAMEKLKMTDYKCVIVGGNFSKVFTSSSEDNYQKNQEINYLGYVTDEELGVLYKNAACFIYPSFYEGFGLPPIEAMSCGCPVIVSNAASLPEVCGAGVVYCNPHDYMDIAQKIEELLKDRELRTSLSASGVRHANTYRWKSFASGVCSELSEIK
ncbi:glycosyl transferase group 1 [Paenibacillus curdlanolyticus YK9]|uniref:Glycosyl transferase group 1 n=1 Tax=Paenibacillus curdlanolyticus YK9 TaxID=717606 RepID=E0I7B1_9BACL|nr:glycosyltransferase family 1 protein [Paenibacillus curdlanolyticus]EFM11927.1 glycosyl transferase group 1 [Paenibacillus curdlanolyticus YK9]